MIQSIYKYRITERLELPSGARILSAEVQGDAVVIYALVNPYEKEKFDNYNIKVLGTGWHVNSEELEGYTFLNTVLLLNNSLVFHVFYKKIN